MNLENLTISLKIWKDNGSIFCGVFIEKHYQLVMLTCQNHAKYVPLLWWNKTIRWKPAALYTQLRDGASATGYFIVSFDAPKMAFTSEEVRKGEATGVPVSHAPAQSFVIVFWGKSEALWENDGAWYYFPKSNEHFGGQLSRGKREPSQTCTDGISELSPHSSVSPRDHPSPGCLRLAPDPRQYWLCWF